MSFIRFAMIVGSSLAAFSLPAATAAPPLSGLRLTPQRTGGNALPSGPATLPPANIDPAKPLQRGSLLNLSV